MIKDYISAFSLDMLFIQEAKNVNLNMSNFTNLKIINNQAQGVPILVRNCIITTDVRKHYSGRLLSIICINIFAM